MTLILLWVVSGCDHKVEGIKVKPEHLKNAEVVYADEPGYSTLVNVNSKAGKCLKYTYWPGFSEQVDTLVWQAESGKWYSKKYTTQYAITDSVVQWWFELKIVHPSSNWQGQTPGLKLVPYQGKRFK